LGIAPHSYQVIDGSGLSRHNEIAPETLVRILRGMAQTPQAQTYHHSLAIAGVNGTLANRFQQSNIEGHLWGKTGTLSGVATLAGYLNLPDREPLVLAIMANHSDLSGKDLRRAIDEIILLLGSFLDC
jgi:D-alanyl-D-alanine carboxypeptidase/D-alanyl-D-alanine-endopeptidase (penicillin-binding protein 4)